MTRKLDRHGNGYTLVFDEAMLDAMNLTPETPLTITISGGSMVITASDVGIPEAELDAAVAKLRPLYSTMLEKLAK